MKKKKLTFKIYFLILLYILIVVFFVLYTRWDRMGYTDTYFTDLSNKENIIDIDGVLYFNLKDQIRINDSIKQHELSPSSDSLLLNNYPRNSAYQVDFMDDKFVFRNFEVDENKESMWDRLINGVKATFFGSTRKKAPETKKKLDTTISDENYNMLLPKFIKITNGQGIEFWEHRKMKEYNNKWTNSIFMYIGKTTENTIYFRTIVTYLGADELDLRNIILESNVRNKLSIADVKEEEYSRKENESFILESVDLSPTKENTAFIQNNISADSIQIIFMGFKKNIKWAVPADQFEALKESFTFFEALKNKETKSTN